jgi:uncharacterized protein YijF (DUF1287 family)
MVRAHPVNPTTPPGSRGSRKSSRIALLASLSLGWACRPATAERADDPGPTASRTAAPAAGAGAETCLGVADRGIWSDLDARIQIALPAGLTADRVRATVDPRHHVLVLYVDGWPTKPYPLGGPARLAVGATALRLRPGDRAELAPLLRAGRLGAPDPGQPDRDGDGIPDPLDAYLGALKTVANGSTYTEGYVTLRFPMGDVPRATGVCTDVIVRALRNAGLDLQAQLHRDIARRRRAYPMVRGRGNASIDQRRVATLLPYFQRHLEAHSTTLGDPDDPWRPGDVVFMDTFPSRPGPDHIGIVSARTDEAGLPLIINNWTDGTVTTEMDLLTFVPITHRFRLAPAR